MTTACSPSDDRRRANGESALNHESRRLSDCTESSKPADQDASRSAVGRNGCDAVLGAARLGSDAEHGEGLMDGRRSPQSPPISRLTSRLVRKGTLEMPEDPGYQFQHNSDGTRTHLASRLIEARSETAKVA